MKIIAFITTPASLSRILNHLGVPTQPPHHCKPGAAKTAADPARSSAAATGFRVPRPGADVAVTFPVG